MQHEVQIKSKSKKKFVESILPSIFSQLKIKSAKYSLLISSSSTIQEEGLTIAIPECGIIILALNSRLNMSRLGLALCHEMVHVKQLVSGVLRVETNGTTWSGKFFKRSTAYMDRPWELQALAKQEIIFRRAIE